MAMAFKKDSCFALCLARWTTLDPCRARAMLLVRSGGIEGRSQVSENARRPKLGSGPGAGTRSDMQPPIIVSCWLDEMNETLSDQLDSAFRRLVASVVNEGSCLRLCFA